MRTLLTLASAMAVAACNMSAGAQEGEGKGGDTRAARRSYDVGPFDSVALGGHHNVIVSVGKATSVRAEGPADELDRLEIRVDGSTLEVGTKRDKRWSVGFKHDRPPVTVYVTVPALKAASIGGSGDMRIDRVQGEDFAASIAGSGDIEVGALQVGQLTVSIAGSGGVTARGSANHSKISVAGSGDIDTSGVEAKTAAVSIVGSGDVRARASETADISIMGSGDVVLDGSARCKISKMGSGDVRCET